LGSPPLPAKACVALPQGVLLLRARGVRLGEAGEDALKRKEPLADRLAGQSADRQPSVLLEQGSEAAVRGLESQVPPGLLAWEVVRLQPALPRAPLPPLWAQV
jgi:hypothetical protein